MMRVLLVLGLVACGREAREDTRASPTPAPRVMNSRPSPPPALSAVVPLVDDEDADEAPVDDEPIAADDEDREAVATVDKPTSEKTTGAGDHTTDHDVDDIPDELDKCPDVPEGSDDDDIDGCPEPMIPSGSG